VSPSDDAPRQTPVPYVRCDRYEDCQERLREACERLECPYREQHPATEARVKALETRATVVESDMKSVAAALNSLRGWIAGAIAAAGALGALAGLIARGAGK
jgi:hypothetical protein